MNEKLSEKAEEILEKLWIKLEEDGDLFMEMDSIPISTNDPVFQELSDRALIEVNDGQVSLRPEGREEGLKVVRRFRLAERLMMDVFNIRGEAAREKACQLEHLLNDGVDTKICSLLNHPSTCPHGKPIPPGECCIEAQRSGNLGVVPLTELKPNEEGEIAYIQTEDNKKMQKLMAMGVLPGNCIRLIQTFPSYIFSVGYSEFAIDTSMAREIFVRR
ncbi:MAG: metal-dependent transcriptional regulator [Geobacteraceae bacterium]|nr:metal-dependent transcriptional regulator [Geobacteraceae bacterium]